LSSAFGTDAMRSVRRNAPQSGITPVIPDDLA
jgi:hypothetical protein